MKLEEITAEIRPRSEWEAVDLGISLARRSVKDLSRSWLMMVLPICLLITLIFHRQPGWAVFGIWWLKPLFERVVLFDLSRSLFGEVPTRRERRRSFLSQIRTLWLLLLLGVGLAAFGSWTHRDSGDTPLLVLLFWSLVMGLAFYRSSITRSFKLSVRFLEDLKGNAYRQRVSLLSRRASSAASGLTMITLFLEIGLMWSFVLFVEIMVPGGATWSALDPTDWGQLVGEMLTGAPDVFSLPMQLGVVGLYFLAMTISAWLYVGGGFGLYINTRTWTEGWDIELSFKRIGQRLSLLLAFFLIGFEEAKAEPAKERVEEVLAHQDFEIHTSESKYWVSDQKKETKHGGRADGLGSFLGVFAWFGQILFWTIILVIVGLVIWVVIKNWHFFQGNSLREKKAEKKIVRTVAGMEITPESLPADVVAVAQSLWREGKRKDALGLLYRGAISWIVAEDVAEISESDTELDCVRRVQEGLVPDLGDPFETLTQTWVGAAYGQKFPGDEQMEQICSAWPFRGRRPS